MQQMATAARCQRSLASGQARAPKTSLSPAGDAAQGAPSRRPPRGRLVRARVISAPEHEGAQTRVVGSENRRRPTPSRARASQHSLHHRASLAGWIARAGGATRSQRRRSRRSSKPLPARAATVITAAAAAAFDAARLACDLRCALGALHKASGAKGRASRLPFTLSGAEERSKNTKARWAPPCPSNPRRGPACCAARTPLIPSPPCSAGGRCGGGGFPPP